MSMPVIRLRQSVQFPANVYGDNGIDVTKANGNYTIKTDWNVFGSISAIPTSPTSYILTFDTATQAYVLVPSHLLGGAASGIADAPINGVQYGRQSGAWTPISAGSLAREKLTNVRTYYVRKDGSDSNDGLTDTAAGAFLTIQAAIDYVHVNIDAAANDIIIQVRAGTYNEDINLWAIVGADAGGHCTLRGDTTTPSNVVISAVSLCCVKATGSMPDWKVEGFKFISPHEGINAHGLTWIRVGVVEFGACAGSQMKADEGGTIELQGNYTISGNAAIHIEASTAGRILNAFATCTLTGGTRAFTAFALSSGAAIDWLGDVAPIGTATGTRYIVNDAGRIDIFGGAIATFFPGNAPGVAVNGSTITGATASSGFDAIATTERIEAQGYAVRAGFAGALGANSFNIYFAPANLWIDSTDLGTIQTSSDYRIKKDVLDLPGMWETVKALRPIQYTQAEYSPPSHEARSPMFEADDIERWGFIAHELQETLTGSAASAYKDAPNAIQAPNAFTVLAALTKALQEAMARIEALEAKVPQ